MEGDRRIINILMIHSSAELYGSDRSLLSIARYLDKEQFHLFVLLPCKGPLLEELKEIDRVVVETTDIAVLRRKNLSPKGGIAYLRSFQRSKNYISHYIIKNNIDVVYTNTSVIFPGAVAAKKCGIKSVWHVREIIRSDLENKVVSAVINRYSDAVIVNSHSTGNRLVIDKRKVKIIYNAVEEYPETAAEEHAGFVVGMGGRINRWKGQKLFVDAAVKVSESFSNVKFLIAGDVYSGEEQIKKELISYIKEKGIEKSVTLLGQVEDMASFYKSLDVFVLPSIQPEPFGLVVLEAMDCGIPVIATNHGGPTEIIENGKTGYLVGYRDSGEMAERIIELLRDKELRKTIGEAGKAEKRTRFSIQKMVDDIQDVFLGLE